MYTHLTHVADALALAALMWLSAGFVAVPAARAAETISLAGPWRFRLDPPAAGVEAKWYSGTLSDRVNLPGSLQEENYGNDTALDTPWVGSTGVNSYLLRHVSNSTLFSERR